MDRQPLDAFLHGDLLKCVKNPKAALGTTDTVVERLDNAVFNKRGVARTRVKLRALQLIGIDTFKTACGEYFVHATLDGEQPTSMMRIFRNDFKGGRFQVDLRVNAKLVFTRVDNSAERLELADPVTLPTSPYARWAYRQTVPNAKRFGAVTVDTDWDGTPDTLLPGTSNFAAGRGSIKLGTGNEVNHDGHTAIE